MSDKTEFETTPPLNSGDIAHTLYDYGTTKLLYTYPSDGNVTLNNFPVGMHFRSKTEAIERLCLQVFGATPVYGTDVEDFKAETPEEMTELEAKLNKTREQLAAERELAKRLEEENANTYLRRWAKAQDQAINAERELDKERALADRLAEALISTDAIIRKEVSLIGQWDSPVVFKEALAAWKEARGE